MYSILLYRETRAETGCEDLKKQLQEWHGWTRPYTDLVVNGDFSQGYTGFHSDYTYINPGDHGDPGEFTIATNSTVINGNYCNMGVAT